MFPQPHSNILATAVSTFKPPITVTPNGSFDKPTYEEILW